MCFIHCVKQCVLYIIYYIVYVYCVLFNSVSFLEVQHHKSRCQANYSSEILSCKSSSASETKKKWKVFKIWERRPPRYRKGLRDFQVFQVAIRNSIFHFDKKKQIENQRAKLNENMKNLSNAENIDGKINLKISFIFHAFFANFKNLIFSNRFQI